MEDGEPRTVVPRRDHVVTFYETDTFLADVVGRRLAAALADGERALVVATRAHLAAFTAALAAHGVDVDDAVARGRLETYDADATLPTLFVDGTVDPVRFDRVVGGLLERATADGRRLSVYGEMVSLLWARGEVTAALALEDLWNDRTGEAPHTLLCGHPLAGFDHDDSDAAFEQLCRRHTAIANEAYVGMGVDAGPVVLERRSA